MIFKIAFRNIFRNSRRSLMSMSTVAVGAVASLVFGAFMVYVFYGLQTGTVRGGGHLTVFRSGYFNFGQGNPGAYGIEDYEGVMGLILADPELKARIAVITPTLAVAGIAGNFDQDTSKTFFGQGFIPSDRQRMQKWDEYHVGSYGERPTVMRDDKQGIGIIGVGMARVLGLCGVLNVPDCPRPPARAAGPGVPGAAAQDFSELVQRDRPAAAAPAAGMPRIDLLAATAGGAPNVVSLQVARAEQQGVKELDDNYVGMHLALAQQLVYGRAAREVTGIVLQLHRTEDLDPVRQRLLELFRQHGLGLEVRDFGELRPLYRQAIGLFAFIFTFITVIIGIVVLFTVANTMGMSVMERVDEIGTARALGVRRRGVRRQFLLEGMILGAIGTTFGVLAAALVIFIVNHAGILWTPPGDSHPVKLELYLVSSLAAGVWLGLVCIATIASFVPANRAARLPIVDALRHV
jgi:putative ABC transport system permease protein